MINGLGSLGDLYNSIASIVGENIIVQITDETIVIMYDNRLFIKDIKDLDSLIGTRGMIEARDSLLIITYTLK